MGRGVAIGQYGTMTRSYTAKDVDSFARLIRDFNPLHSSSSSSFGGGGGVGNDNDDGGGGGDSLLALQHASPEAAGWMGFQTNTTRTALVHGVFVAGVFSSVFAHLAPGCVYTNQTLDFVSPVFAGDTVVGCVHVENVRDRSRRNRGVVVQCRTRVYTLSSNHNKNEGGGGGGRQPPQPTPAKLSVNGRASVWLPIGYPGAEER